MVRKGMKDLTRVKKWMDRHLEEDPGLIEAQRIKEEIAKRCDEIASEDDDLDALLGVIRVLMVTEEKRESKEFLEELLEFIGWLAFRNARLEVGEMYGARLAGNHMTKEFLEKQGVSVTKYDKEWRVVY